MSDQVELLFFDTFAHDNSEEINLDLVQFPKPVFVVEVRIIPLGARVQADFPGGVRLGATNPSQFDIEFFVNDLGKPGASTFESLGGFKYDQNGCINLECTPNEGIRKIPTDGLVLRGWYTTITLAVYGTLTNNINEQIIPPVTNPTLTKPNIPIESEQVIAGSPLEGEWLQDGNIITPLPIDYSAQQTTSYQQFTQPEQYVQEFNYYTEAPKDPRSYHHTPEADWDKRSRDEDREHNRDAPYQKPIAEREQQRPENDRREREKRYSRSESKDRDRQSREYHDNRESDSNWPEQELPEYRVDRNDHDWNDRDRNHERDRYNKHDDNYRRSYNRNEEREDRKRPRTPPSHSPKKPHSPQVQEANEAIKEEVTDETDKKLADDQIKGSPVKEQQTTEEPIHLDIEEFEPILSDEDILDDSEHYQDMDFDYTAYTNTDDIMKLFTPGVNELQKYPKKTRYTIENNSIEMEENFRISIGITDDYFKSSITKYDLDTFVNLNTEIKEEFVHLCEKVLSIIGPSEKFCDINKLHTDVKHLKNLSPKDREVAEQVEFIITTMLDWLKIAMSFELANLQTQPTYKIRHLKCGVRLADYCCTSDIFLEILSRNDVNFNVHKNLLYLYEQEFMALSIKLAILKALDTYLHHKVAIVKFLWNDNLQNGTVLAPMIESEGYKSLINYIRDNPSVRIKFALTSIVKKLNLYEILHRLNFIIDRTRDDKMTPDEIKFITKSLNVVLNYCKIGSFVLSQPKRFLPVTCQFEISRDCNNDIILDYFRMFNLLHCFLVLLTSQCTMNLPLIKAPIYEILSTFLTHYEGVQYLSENIEVINVLLKCLLRIEDDIQYENVDLQSHHLGLQIAYKLQALYHIESLLYNTCDLESPDVIDNLHALFCLSFSPFGKTAVAESLGLGDNIQCLLRFLELIFSKDKPEMLIARYKNSPSIGYIVDLIFLTVTLVPNIPLLEKNSKILLHFVNQHDLFEENENNKLTELKYYLLPFEENSRLKYDNIAVFVDIIVKNMENFPHNLGPIITSLRIIQHLGIGPSVSTENPLAHYAELKYKHVILQLFSLDGTSIIIKLLQKICEYYEQPSIHSSIIVSSQGWILVNSIKPSVLLIKQMLSYVIQCQNTNFKDLTAIPVLLQTYNLLNNFPASSPTYSQVQDIKTDIVDTFLVYTQTVSEQVNEKDSLTKTLWTLMIGEVIKYTTAVPHTFISGLLIFSELLPLPLPLQTRDDLTDEEISWIISLRKLWSAHLHPHSTMIQNMVNKLCLSTQPQLLNLLRRICVQIADLAANSAVMIARGILDNVYDALVPKENAKVAPCGPHLARMLNFLACLVTRSTIKCAVLHLLHSNSTVTSKTEEKYVNLIPAFAQILKINSTNNSHVQAQECILSIIQSFCDIEITLTQTKGVPSDQYLANALPIKDHLLGYIQLMGEHLTTENSFVTYLPILRTLLLLTEHDYGFVHLKEHLLKKIDFCSLLGKLLANFSKDNADCLSVLNTLVEFLRVCATVEDDPEGNLLYHPRKMKLSPDELKTLLKWPGSGDNELHPLLKLEKRLKDVIEGENNPLETFLEGLTALLKLLEEESCSDKDVNLDINVPAPDTLLVQFSQRMVFSSSDACDERLTANYWLGLPSDEAENDLEHVSVDLIEICRQNFRPEFNLIKEIEKLCRISRSENTDERIKKLEDEDVKIKKPFVPPMRQRGFPRNIPQRPDPFRSRPPNTSRPPSLHVDDFVALETCGAQPTGPTGYNKISREMLASNRIARGTRGRSFVTSERSMQYRQMSWWGAGLGRGPY